MCFPPWRAKQLLIIFRHATWCLLFACRVRFVMKSINFPNFLLSYNKTSVSLAVIIDMSVVKRSEHDLIPNDMTKLGHGMGLIWFGSQFVSCSVFEITTPLFSLCRLLETACGQVLSRNHKTRTARVWGREGIAGHSFCPYRHFCAHAINWNNHVQIWN